MELFSTRLDLWYGEYHYDPYWDDEEEWEDTMTDKTPANDAMAEILVKKNRTGPRFDSPTIELVDGKWTVVKKTGAGF